MIKKPRRRPRFLMAEKNQLPRSNRLARYGHHRLLTRLTPLHQLMLHQLILCSAFFPPVAFHRLALPPACCVADHGHSDDAEEAEAELCCGHDAPFPIAALVC
jgi:hypothetical protein